VACPVSKPNLPVIFHCNCSQPNVVKNDQSKC